MILILRHLILRVGSSGEVMSSSIPMPTGPSSGSTLAPDDQRSFRWRQDFLRAYVEREIPLLVR